jgi:hypothetical protein
VLGLPSSPRLRRILLAYAVNQLGTWFGRVALSLAVYDRTHSAVAVTALFIASYLPALAVPAFVAWVEALRGRGRLSLLYLFEAAATALLAAFLWHFLLFAVLIVVALDGAGALTANSLLRAQAAGTDGPGSSEEASQDGNAALNVVLSLTLMFGPPLAALAVNTLGGPAALLIDAASFLLCAGLLLDLSTHVEERTGTSVRARLAVARDHIRASPALRTLLLTEAAALIFFETGAPVEVFFAKGTLHAGDLGYGALIAVWGVGMVAGSILFARAAGRSLGGMLTAGTLAVGLAYIGFAASPDFSAAVLAALLGGIGNGVQWASLIGAVQRLTPERLHGRLMGGVEAIGSVGPLVGLPLSGLVMALGTPRIAFLAFGLAATATTVGFARLWVAGALDARGASGSTSGALAEGGL